MSVIYDGHNLDELFVCGDPSITIFDSRVKYDEADNRNGAVVLGRTWGSGAVVFSIGVHGSAHERRDKFSVLAAWLDVDEPKKLVLPDNPERYYLAIPEGQLTPERGIGGEIAQLTFTLTDPIAYGAEQTIEVPSGGSIAFVVGGTASTQPFIYAGAIPNSSSHIWGLRLDERDYVHIDLGDTLTHAVEIDCHERIAKISNAIALPTLDSDWLELTPGEHVLRMDNGTTAGTATVTYVERWY